MLVLGIDPGTATIGYGLVRKISGKLGLVASGLIETDKEMEHGERLTSIFEDFSSLLKLHKPDLVAIERLFFFINAKTAIQVAQATGVLFMAASQNKVPLKEYMPRQIKLQVFGDGKASKKDIKNTIFKTFGIQARKNHKTHFDNEADAIAVALCHFKMMNVVR